MERNTYFDGRSYNALSSKSECVQALGLNEDAEEQGLLVRLPCKQYTTVYYILGQRIYVGWYLAHVGESTHLILQDRIEMGVCWATDGTWFLTREAAETALANIGDSNA